MRPDEIPPVPSGDTRLNDADYLLRLLHDEYVALPAECDAGDIGAAARIRRSQINQWLEGVVVSRTAEHVTEQATTEVRALAPSPVPSGELVERAAVALDATYDGVGLADWREGARAVLRAITQQDEEVGVSALGGERSAGVTPAANSRQEQSVHLAPASPPSWVLDWLSGSIVEWLYAVGYPFDFQTAPPIPAFLRWPLVRYAAAQDHTDPSWFTTEALQEYYDLMADEGGWIDD